MHIVLVCATARGLRCLQTLHQSAPHHRITVFSFREEAHEPPFLDDIRAYAEAHKLTFHEAKQLGAETWQAFWQTEHVDMLFAVSWRYMIPPSVYQRTRLGAFVFHDSMLPAYRGFAPTVWAMINGEDHTGVTLFEMAEAVDSGDIIAQQRVPMGADDTIGDVLPRVTDAYCTLLQTHLPSLLAGTAPRMAQDHRQATYTCKRLPDDARIDWSQPATVIYNLIRASAAPYTGALTTLHGDSIRIWGAQRLPDFPPYIGRIHGRIIEVRVGVGSVVLAGDGALLITQAQRADEPIKRADRILMSINHTLGR
jgi:methionyl-tRNA formyltransferase